MKGRINMLIEFSVKNFRSFRDEVIFSMEAGNGDELPNNVFEVNNTKILKTASLYGANASGKSNFMRAFTAAIMMVRNSNMIPLGARWAEIVPFLLDECSRNEPTVFTFVFIANGVKYRYCFGTDGEKIQEESLDAYYSQKPSNIFKRTNVNDYKFITEDNSRLKALVARNTDNKLFLATATNWNYDKTKDAFLWFMNSIDTYDSFDMIADEDLVSYSKDDSPFKDFSLKLLRETDILIKDIHVDYAEKDMDTNMMDLLVPPAIKNNGNSKFRSLNIEVEHEIELDNGNKKTYTLNFGDESSGTKILFALAPSLMRAFAKTRVLIVDELEKSLHPSLVEYIIKIFNNPNINKANSQLIFTTHAVSLLDLDLLRRDQIWFAEKNPMNGVTDLYPLDDFSVRKDENIQKGYINGRYGAIPFIGNGIDLWRE